MDTYVVDYNDNVSNLQNQLQHLTSYTILKLAGSSASMNSNIPVHVYPLPSSRYPSWQEHW